MDDCDKELQELRRQANDRKSQSDKTNASIFFRNNHINNNEKHQLDIVKESRSSSSRFNYNKTREHNTPTSSSSLHSSFKPRQPIQKQQTTSLTQRKSLYDHESSEQETHKSVHNVKNNTTKEGSGDDEDDAIFDRFFNNKSEDTLSTSPTKTTTKYPHRSGNTPDNRVGGRFNNNNHDNHNHNHSNNSNNNYSQRFQPPKKEYEPFIHEAGMKTYLSKKILDGTTKTDENAQERVVRRDLADLLATIERRQLDDIFSRENLSSETIRLIIKLLASDAIKDSVLQHRTNELYQLFLASKVVEHHSNLYSYLSSFINERGLLDVGTVFHQVSTRFQYGCNKIPFEPFKTMVSKYYSNNKTLKEIIRLIELKKIAILDGKQNPDIPVNYQVLPIVPTIEELNGPLPNLRSLLTGCYESKDVYIDSQFKLLREDLVHPLRESIQLYLSDDEAYCKNIYEDIEFLANKSSYHALSFTIRFKIKKPIKWNKSSRLMLGNLIGLTNDEFHSIYWATVTNRPTEGSESKIDISFIDDNHTKNIGLFYLNTWTMVESPSYFEQHKNILTSLKNIQTVPFEDYFISCNLQNMKPPKYILENPYFDFSKTFYKDIKNPEFSKTTYEKVNVLDDSNIPSNLGTMDNSQKDAFLHSLRNELALIQGPPGTGKSYLGLKLFENILQHQKHPILLICFSNHALDQFLSSVLNITHSVIRIGNQSRDPEMEQFNLKNISKSREYYAAFNERRLTISAMNRILKLLSKNAIPIEYLEKAGGLTRNQKKIFIRVKNNRLKRFKQWINHMDLEISMDGLVQKKGTNPQSKSGSPVNNTEYISKVDEDDIDDEDEDAVRELIFLSRLLDADDTLKKEIKPVNLTPTFQIMSQPSYSFENVDNLFDLDVENRKLYWAHIQKKFIEMSLDKYNQLVDKFKEQTDILKEYEHQSYVSALSTKKVIGVTTTGASRLKNLLSSLKSKVVIIEEAAEVMESHILSVVPPTTEHLIMIGDHLQLRPSSSVYQLKKHKIDVSLFERITKLPGSTFKTLNVQRRMAPNISCFIKSIYPDLENHESVVDRSKSTMDRIVGLQNNVHFIDHRFHEETNDNTVSSKVNMFEVDFIVQLTLYLLKQGSFTGKDIVILTPYTGQLLKIKSRLFKLSSEIKEIKNVLCRTVDQFQGEERNIVLVSLVRSNMEKVSGFISITNRINVTLSRAKLALYLIGNGDLLKNANPLWEEVFEILKDRGCYSSYLPIVCSNHPKNVSKITCAEDFKKVSPSGGCYLLCEDRLKCGHQCHWNCHTIFNDHNLISCNKRCENVFDCGHTCRGLCSAPCLACSVLIEKKLVCGHSRYDNCSHDTKCLEKCEIVLDCGHTCLNKCSQPCGNCMTLVKRRLPCDHVLTLPCSQPYDGHKCNEKVKVLLDCGHTWMVKCHEKHLAKTTIQCDKKCDKPMSCGHKCNKKCYEPCQSSKECNVKVKITLNCSHPAEVKCIDRETTKSKTCKIQVEKTLECGHTVKSQCSDPLPSYKLCRSPCLKILDDCKHPCSNLCCEPCSNEVCQTKVVKIRPCGHKVEERCSTKSQCPKSCPHLLESCGHPCKLPCSSHQQLPNSDLLVHNDDCQFCKSGIQPLPPYKEDEEIEVERVMVETPVNPKKANKKKNYNRGRGRGRGNNNNNNHNNNNQQGGKKKQ